MAYLGVKGIGPVEVKSASAGLQDVITFFNELIAAVRVEAKEVANLFLKPWWILPEITTLKTDLIILRLAISQLEKSA